MQCDGYILYTLFYTDQNDTWEGSLNRNFYASASQETKPLKDDTTIQTANTNMPIENTKRKSSWNHVLNILLTYLTRCFYRGRKPSLSTLQCTSSSKNTRARYSQGKTMTELANTFCQHIFAIILSLKTPTVRK